jgi:choline-sulfatase
MKQIIFAALAAAVSTTAYGQQGLQRQEPARVPVVIIMADQLRPDAIGRFTPSIDALAKDGVTFDRVYCAVPLCAPSRAAFNTGRYPDNNGCLINGWNAVNERYRQVRAGVPDLYRQMSPWWDAWQSGKQHFFSSDSVDRDPRVNVNWITQDNYNAWIKAQGVKKPGGRAFTALVPELFEGRYTHTKRYTVPVCKPYAPGLHFFPDDYFADTAVSIIQNHRPGKPLLLITTFLSPHPPFNIPEPYFSLVKPSDLTVPDDVGKWYPHQSPLQLYALTGFIGSRYSREQWKYIWTKYFGLVNLMDHETGRILDALKKKGLYDKALIIFTADHGEMLGSHSLWMKNCMYEASARVPFIIKFPAGFHPAFRHSDSLVSLIDVWPTLLDYLHIRPKGRPDGLSFMPLLEGKVQQRPRVFLQYDGNAAYGSNQRCVVEGDYKLIIDTFEEEVYLELYDERKDPEETTNLVLDPAYEARTKKLIAEIRTHMKATGDGLQLPAHLYENFLTHYKK